MIDLENPAKMFDLDTLVQRLIDLEDRYYDLQSKYHQLIHEYETLKEKYEDRAGHRNEPSTRQDLAG
jgi:hypothetical protein